MKRTIHEQTVLMERRKAKSLWKQKLFQVPTTLQKKGSWMIVCLPRLRLQAKRG